LVIAQVMAAFEQASRGQMDVLWTAPKARRVLITGFDPFSLDKQISQSNPSGAVVLALDGQVFAVDGVMVEINAAVFPVRYPDFDAGVLEQWLTPHLTSGGLDLFVSVSMGRDQFDLERFPGRRRSSSALGNLQEHTGGSAASPKPGLLDGKPLQGPEFVEFSLPAAVMQQAQGEFEIRDNHRVSTLEGGAFEAVSLAALHGQTAVQGSGGGYLSNEISYRSIRLANELGVALPMGHIHTPKIAGQAPETVSLIIKQVERMLLLAAKSGA
jgi:pyrrolidone-carboxylate peptidase